WAKVERLEGGDRMLASSMVTSLEDRRDATFVRYVLLVDANARNKRLAPHFEPVTFYGQLRHIFVVNIQPAAELGLEDAETVILAAISECKTIGHNDLDMHYYRDEGALQIVDITTVQCLVGRVKTLSKKHWALIDRSGSLARPYY
ncbi:hypothetical protein DFH06DRAFT_928953, partial [Mycena polygramma]